MRPLSTLIRLLCDSRRYAAIHDNSWWPIFKNLIILYIKSKFSGKGNELVFHNFTPFKVYAYDFPILIALYEEIFLKKVYAFEPENEKPFIVDCGANIGMSVLYFKTLYPQSEIWAFEPNPNAYTLLEKNIATNCLEGVRLFNYAVSDIDAPIDFYVPLRKGSLNASSKNSSKHKLISVDGKKLSGLLPKKGIDFIKIDIEGDEAKVVKDLSENQLLQSVKELVIEFHPQGELEGKDLAAFLSYFKGHFSYEQSAFNHENRSSKDLIFSFRNRAR